MKNLKLLTFLLLALFIVIACTENKSEVQSPESKEEEPQREEKKPPTPKEILASHPWLVDSVSTDIAVPGFQVPSNIKDSFNPTANLKGQKIVLNADGTFSAGEGDNAQSGTWELSADNSTLTFKGLTQPTLEEYLDEQTLQKLQTFQVKELSETKLAIMNSNKVPVPEQVIEAVVGAKLPIQVMADIRVNIAFVK